MIKTRKQFEERLKKLRKDVISFYISHAIGYREAIDDVLKLIEDEGECFKE